MTPIGVCACDVSCIATIVDVFIINSGGVRTVITARPVKMGELYRAFPFDDFICTTIISGAQLINLIEYCV
ncbi:MAG: 5'-nucleotidase C-terminal domain-containing protein [Fusobacteria bacterium]|nr:5'-nucleotidase C-terminal domain-containing protein [Fusobacteriota bacterium]